MNDKNYRVMLPSTKTKPKRWYNSIPTNVFGDGEEHFTPDGKKSQWYSVDEAFKVSGRYDNSIVQDDYGNTVTVLEGLFIVVSGFNNKEFLSSDLFHYTGDKKDIAVFTKKSKAKEYARNKDYIEEVTEKEAKRYHLIGEIIGW